MKQKLLAMVMVFSFLLVATLPVMAAEREKEQGNALCELLTLAQKHTSEKQTEALAAYAYLQRIFCETKTVNPDAMPEPDAPAATTKPERTPAATAPRATPEPTKQNNGSIGSAEQKQLLQMINTDRQKQGLPALQLHSALSAGALAHSRDMAANNYFSHSSPKYGNLSQRTRAAGIDAAVGENIALYGSLEKAHAALMASEGHRKNILGSGFSHVGIGVVYSKEKGGYYITEWFAKMN